MDILNLLLIYTVILAVGYVIYGMAVALEQAIAEVTGHTYASLWAESKLILKLAPIKLFGLMADLGEGKAATASPRYFT
jgi:Na+/H+-dicarboxylate symporter